VRNLANEKTKERVFQFAFQHSPLKNQLHLAEIQSNEALYKALFNNLTPLFLDDLKWRVSNSKNVNILVEGEQGSGKSTIAREIKAYMDRYKNLNPTIADICFDRKEFLERFKTAKKYETIINDEDKSWSVGIGSTRVAEQYEYLEQAIRAEMVNVINCAVAITPHLFNYRLRAFDVDYNLGINRAILYDSQSRWNSKPSGVIILPNGWLYPQLEADYAKKKAEFTDTVKQARSRDVYGELAVKQKLIMEKYGGHKKLKRAVITLLCRKEFPELSESELGALNELIWNAQDVNELLKFAEDADKAVKEIGKDNESETPILKKAKKKVRKLKNSNDKQVVADATTTIKAD